MELIPSVSQGWLFLAVTYDLAHPSFSTMALFHAGSYFLAHSNFSTMTVFRAVSCLSVNPIINSDSESHLRISHFSLRYVEKLE
jgi:hypothetical protein